MSGIKKILFFIVLSGFFSWNSRVFSQGNYEHTIDSLNTKIEAEKNDTSRVRLIQTCVYSGLNHGDMKNVSKFLKMMKKEIDAHRWEKGEMMYHHANGVYLFYTGNYNGSLKENLSSLKIAKKRNDKRAEARSYGNIALVYQVRSDYVKSLEFHFKGLDIEKELKNDEGIADSYNNIGIVYENLDQFKKALWFQTKSVALRIKLKDYYGVQKNYSNIGNIYFSQNKRDSALSNYERGLRFAIKLEDQNAVGIALANIANVHYEEKEYVKAIEYSRRAFKIFREVANERGWIAAAGNMGENYFKLNQLDSARYYTEMAVDKARQMNAIDLELTCLSTMVKLNEKENKFKEAYYLQQRTYMLRDSINGEEKKADLARFEVKHEYAVKEERRKANAMLEKRRQTIILYSVIAGLIVALLFGAVVLRNLVSNKRKNKIIHDQKLVLEAKQKEILDSIHYAKRIQEALLPSQRYVTRNMDRLNKK